MVDKAYYNEIDPGAAAWLRELIKAGHIAAGDVDERSIEDVRPSDLRGYTQCHFFAGIGGWSLALRLAGWDDSRPVWTGSCPCQPFSSAGKGAGFADERHLWPAFFHLIEQCRPTVVFGEQVASSDGLQWLDLVSADLEAAEYAFGAADLCAAGVGAPHIRQRLYWVADAVVDGRQDGRHIARRVDAHGERPAVVLRDGRADVWVADSNDAGKGLVGNSSASMAIWPPDDTPSGLGRGGAVGRLADADGGHPGAEGLQRSREHGQQPQDSVADWLVHGLGSRLEGHGDRSGAALGHGEGAVRPATPSGEPCRLADDALGGRREERANAGWLVAGDRAQRFAAGLGASGGDLRPSPLHGFWRDADWLLCRDGKWRPVEPGTLPLAHGIPARVGRLRGYGNAIVPQVAETFIRAYAGCGPLLTEDLY